MAERSKAAVFLGLGATSVMLDPSCYYMSAPLVFELLWFATAVPRPTRTRLAA